MQLADAGHQVEGVEQGSTGTAGRMPALVGDGVTLTETAELTILSLNLAGDLPRPQRKLLLLTVEGTVQAMTAWSHLAAPGRLDALKWRCIGPARGRRVVAVAGDPLDPMVFYFGACAGGIWKTIDGGIYWRCVSDGFLGSAAIGAIAVARSDRNVIYAGTGETEIRLDVSYGDGIYKSTDAGRTWSHMGLRETKHIGRICIHPTNPDIVYVAALGDIFGPHEERGVFRTRDGGKTWDKVLYRER